jgi:DNA-binding transcriptional LysR family regulator
MVRIPENRRLISEPGLFYDVSQNRTEGESMNTLWFRAFLEASDHKSLSKAGEKLNLTQPALSKQIRNLEQWLGVELFRRSSLGVELTEEGALFRERIRPVLSEIESIRNDLLNMLQISKIRLGALPSLATHYLPTKLTELKRQGIHVEMKVLGSTEEIVASLRNGALDAGIGQKTETCPKTYWIADLFCEPFYAIVPESHRLSRRQSVTLADLKEEALVVYPHPCDVRTTIAEAYRMNGWNPVISMEIPFGDSIPGFVAAGAGISILPEMMAGHLHHTSLKAIPIEQFGKTRTIGLMTSHRATGNRLKRFF